MSTTTRGRRAETLSGAAAAVASLAAGLGLAELAAAVLDPRTSPVALVGGVVIDLVPPAVKDAVIAVAGTHDKLVLTICVVVGTLAITALVGSRLARTAVPAMLWAGAVGAIALVAALWRIGPSLAAATPGLVLGAVAIAALALIRRHLPDAAAATSSASTASSARPIGGAERRRLLAAIAGSTGVGIVAAVAASAVRPEENDAAPLALPAPQSSPPELPEGLDVDGISPLRTPVEDLYRIDTALIVPGYRPEDWDLTIDGDVESPYTLTLPELLAEPLVEIDATMLCVSNPVGGDLVGSVRFQGVRVRDLLLRARPGAGADQVLSTSADGFTAGSPLDVLLEEDRDALVVVGINGEPLTPEHGAPVRLFTPGLYGYVGATKWLRRLTVGTFAENKAYWTTRGWSERGPVKTSARIDTPRDGDRVRPGSDGAVPIAGVAWAVHRGVSAVQVSVDGSDWQEAELSTDVNADYWRQWVLRAALAPGRHTVRARALDGSGAVQESEPANPAPDGAQGYHEVEVTVRS
ncbi:molybdopterin-dependent oxidoreductase [Brachybacterium huguangmaarense]